MHTYDIIIIGAGPSGLSCGIEAQKNELSYLIIDKGGITDAIRRFPVNITFFSTPELLELGDVPFVCTNIRPSRVEVLEYYRKVVEYFNLNLRLHTIVSKIDNPGNHFEIHTADKTIYKARNVIAATGYFDNINRLNVKGEDLPHVTHYYTEPFAYASTNVTVIGGRNSAVETALDLYRHGAHVTLVHRGPKLGSVKYWILPDVENRIKEDAINAYFNYEVQEISPKKLIIKNNQNQKLKTINADFVIALIGYRPDEKLLNSAGVHLDNETLIPEYNKHTFETNVRGIYIAGSVACGCKIWDIFIENGREHSKPIMKNIKELRN